MSSFILLPDEESSPQSCRLHRLTGQKPPLKPKEVWAILIRLQIQCKYRDLALFNLAVDSKLRSCDLVALRINDVLTASSVRERTVITQQKTGRPVQFELTEQTRLAVHDWITFKDLRSGDYLFPSRVSTCSHLSTRQYVNTSIRQYVNTSIRTDRKPIGR